MAPSFINSLRRKSKASFRTDRSTDSSNRSNESTGSNGAVPTTKSSSTLNSTYGSQTPPSGLQSSNSSSNLQLHGSAPPSIRPSIQAPVTKRYSVSGMSGLGSPSINGNSTLPTSPYAPRIISISDGHWVYQKVLLIYGNIGDPASQSLDGTLTISRMDDDFPAIQWPVCDSHFKALLHLTPGPNKIRFDFSSPKLANSNSSNPIHSSHITLHMMPTTSAPPLQLVILLGSDSPGTYDAVPARIEREGNGIEAAVKKFRMAAHLWQAFTSEQMYRNKMGRRCFRFEEEWQSGTLNYRDRELGTMRNEAKIHVIRSSKTVAEIRDIDVAQQNPNAQRSGDLFSFATENVRQYFKTQPGQKQYVSVLLLDAHWDKGINMLTGHAALGGGGGEIQLAIFGSHALQSYPSSMEEVVPAFTDCTPTDTNFVANDCNESGSSWEAANIGIGAHLHETGHLFGCPHQESGIMLRDYVTLNRTFTIREPFSTRTNSKGGLVLAKDECAWHRLDCLRFRSHPCFKLPNDSKMSSDQSVLVWPVDNGNVLVTAPTGVSYIEMFLEGDGFCHNWIEYGDGNGTGPIQRQVVLTEQDLRGRLREDQKTQKLKLIVKSHGGGSHEIEDFTLLASKASLIKLSNGHMAFRGSKLGMSQMEGTTNQEIVLDSTLLTTKVIKHVIVYHGCAVDGIEFVYEDRDRQLFGKEGGTPGGSQFTLDVRRGEVILGFNVRSGFWIDGLQIITSIGRRSEWYGSATGGSLTTLIPPRGYNLAGVYGSSGAWMDGFSILITR